MSDAQYSYVGPPDAPDRYELIERRAAGGEGEVWRAREHHGTVAFSYAVKILRVPEEDQGDRGLEGLRLQAALATQLEHPALVKVKDVFVGPPPHPAGQAAPDAGPRLYFVMKWIEGHSLQEGLERGDVRGLDILRPLEPIAEAVDYLHSGRDTDGIPVLHRDIKPANILVAGDGRVYLVDFGLVRLHSTSGTARLYGTAPFMAPESLARGEYTPATDRYALGATVYYALTGEMPVPGDTEGMTERLTAALGPGQDRVVRGILSMVAVVGDRRPSAAAAWIRALRGAPMETSIGEPSRPAPPPPTAGPADYPLPPGVRPSSAPPPTAGPADYPLPPGAQPSGAPGPRPSSGPPAPGPGPSGYPPPPGTPPSSGPPAGPSHYPMPPNSGPVGYPLPPGPGPSGFPGRPRKKSKVPLIVAIVSVLVFLSCFIPGLVSILNAGGFGGGNGASPAPSIDRASPPPAVTALEPVLLSVADVMSALKVGERDTVKPSAAEETLQGGPADLSFCSDGGRVDGAAIGANSSNGYWVTTGTYPRIGSAVAGFYGNAADPFLDAARAAAQRCEWRSFTVPKLGQESFGATIDTSMGTYQVIMVRSGQVLFEVAMDTNARGVSGQSELIKMATSMSKRLPKIKASR
ncbi:serine/threonine-protein kinase [Plantactinospora sp. CA-290183]|uniref:serine/threonine-protein kinase n=1 Tax=Plantactinospora sp. CA-290183 TaxID=3240006 RepID=UPI003D8B4995